MKGERELLTVDGREVAISNPRKVLFPEAGFTKLDLVRYYLAIADGALRGAGGRPRSSRRTARRSRPGRRRPVAAAPGSRAHRPSDARGFRTARVAQDLGLARNSRQRSDRTPLDIPRGSTRGARAGARNRATGTETRDEQVVEGRAARRLHRLQ